MSIIKVFSIFSGSTIILAIAAFMLVSHCVLRCGWEYSHNKDKELNAKQIAANEDLPRYFRSWTWRTIFAVFFYNLIIIGCID